eukprot:jgi/Phyca11/570447/estExt2_Genewise1.C_PHYCAscaffold_370222
MGNFRIVQLLAMHFRECHVPSKVAGNAAKRGLSNILMALNEWGYDIEWDADVVRLAIGNGHFELAKWLKEKIPTASVNGMVEWAEVAAATGDLAIVKWFISLHAELGDIPPPKLNLYEAVSGGHINVITWLIEHYPEMCFGDNADFSAADNGHLDILHLLLSSPMGMCETLSAINAAAEKGYLDIVKFLVKERYSVNYAMDDAAENGFLDIVRWLHENTTSNCTFKTRAMDNAAGNGHLDVVKYLHRNRKEGCTIRAMDSAAQQGHLRVVQWLHENRTEGCSTRAMDMAASAGNLEMVKWLHFNRSEGCTTTAMNNAAEGGYLDVVKWLHVNRLEGCTSSAMTEAAANNQLAVIKWLDQNRTEGFRSAAFIQAVKCGHLEILKWLFSRGVEHELGMAAPMEDAATFGYFDVVWFLHHNFRECGSIEALKNAMSPFCRLGFAEWAYARHRHEFERDIAEHLFAD